MNTEELEQYNKLTDFQRSVVDALVELGFKHKYFSTYELIGWGDVNVGRLNKLPDVLCYVFQQGKDQKRFEIQRALGI